MYWCLHYTVFLPLAFRIASSEQSPPAIQNVHVLCCLLAKITSATGAYMVILSEPRIHASCTCPFRVRMTTSLPALSSDVRLSSVRSGGVGPRDERCQLPVKATGSSHRSLGAPRETATMSRSDNTFRRLACQGAGTSAPLGWSRQFQEKFAMIRRLDTHLGHFDTETNDMAGREPNRPHSARLEGSRRSMHKSTSRRALSDSFGSKVGLYTDATVSSQALMPFRSPSLIAYSLCSQ